VTPGRDLDDVPRTSLFVLAVPSATPASKQHADGEGELPGAQQGLQVDPLRRRHAQTAMP